MIQSRLRYTSLAVATAAALVLAACGGGDGDSSDSEGDSTPAGGDATVVQVTLGQPSELELTADPASVAAGDVTFEVANEGALLHEFILIRTDEDISALPTANAALDLSGLDEVTALHDLQPGTDGSTDANLSAGTYLMVCNIPGHYMTMNATLTVE